MNDNSSSDHIERDLLLLSEREVRRRLAGHRLSFVILRPPYAALGVGELRVLRITVADEAREIVAGYERYERLPA